MKIVKYCAIGLFAFVCFSCNNSGQADSTQAAKDSNATRMDSTGVAKDSSNGPSSSVPSSVSKSDGEFVVNTANAGMTEIQAGQIAEQKGMSKEVKDYGAMMVKDHTAAAAKLKTIASSKNLTLPSAVSPEMQKNLDDLNQKTGKDFDKAYIDMMVSDHKKVISSFEDEAKNGSDADIRGFADSTLHILRHHLDEAQKCQKMMK